jgi:hypothetical protein
LVVTPGQKTHVPFLHGIRDAVIKDQQSRRNDKGPRTQQRNKGPRRKMTAMSEEEGIQQNLQEDCRIGDQQANL